MAKHSAPLKPMIACSPLYPPVELVHAAGYHPLVLWNLEDLALATKSSDTHLQPFCCSVARRMTEYLLSPEADDVAAFLFMNACDTIRNLPEIVEQGLRENGRSLPMLRFHLPAARLEGANARGYLAEEIHRLQKKLGVLANASVTESRFRESVALYSLLRKTMLSLEEQVCQGAISFETYCACAQRANREPVEQAIPMLEDVLAKATPQPPADGQSRIVLSGIVPPPSDLFPILEGAGLQICANDVASLHRSIAYIPETFISAADYYQQFYAQHFPCPTLLHTADRRMESLLRLVRTSQACAVIFVGEKFCEYEFFEIPYVARRLNEAGIATLTLEFAIDGTSLEAQKTRIEAFAEQIQRSREVS